MLGPLSHVFSAIVLYVELLIGSKFSWCSVIHQFWEIVANVFKVPETNYHSHKNIFVSRIAFFLVMEAKPTKSNLLILSSKSGGNGWFWKLIRDIISHQPSWQRNLKCDQWVTENNWQHCPPAVIKAFWLIKAICRQCGAQLFASFSHCSLAGTISQKWRFRLLG